MHTCKNELRVGKKKAQRREFALEALKKKSIAKMSQQKRKQAGKKQCVIILLRKQAYVPSTAWKPRIFSAEGGGDGFGLDYPG